MATRRLTLKQARFVAELPTARSATEAAIKAGYSPANARFQASKNTTKANLAERLAQAHAVIAEEQKITEAEVAEGLRREAAAGDKKKPHSARVQALMGLAKLGGLVDKPMVPALPPQVNVYLQELPLRELLALREAMQERLKLKEGEHG